MSDSLSCIYLISSALSGTLQQANLITNKNFHTTCISYAFKKCV